MKFGHFHAPKSWSLLHLLTCFYFHFVKNRAMNNFDHGNFFIQTWEKYSRSGILLKNAVFEHWEEFYPLAVVIENDQISSGAGNCQLPLNAMNSILFWNELSD